MLNTSYPQNSYDLRMADYLALVGVVFIILLTVVSYPILNDRLALADIQSISWGPAISGILPILLTAFASLFSVVLIIVSSRGGLKP
jgi:uncharacterized BrkB/YihY/UPF0761 family membrane protein